MQGSSGEGETGARDAVELLMEAYRHLEKLLAQVDRLDALPVRQECFRTFAAEVAVVATVEDRMFYRRLQRAEPSLSERVVRARRELMEIYRAVSALKQLEPADAAFDSAVHALRERLHLHCRRNALDVYPAARRSSVDLQAMGAMIGIRMRELRLAEVPSLFAPESHGGR